VGEETRARFEEGGCILTWGEEDLSLGWRKASHKGEERDLFSF
jgi:hypothetical protein